MLKGKTLYTISQEIHRDISFFFVILNDNFIKYNHKNAGKLSKFFTTGLD